MNYTMSEVLQFVQENDVKFVRLAFCDMFGTLKNISILADELPYYFAEEQSAGQIADRIQRRVQLYLEETRR